MIYIITQRDPFFIDAFLLRFDKFDIPYSVLDLPSFNKGFYSGLKRAFNLYGTGGFIKLVLYYVGKRLSFKLTNLVDSSSYNNIEEVMANLKTIYEGDVILSLSAPCRIPVERFPNKIRKYNIHCGKLPEYAGMMPIFWQMLDGKENITITIHDLAPEIDTGGIIIESKMTVEHSLFITSVKAKEKSAELFRDLLEQDFGYVAQIPSTNTVKLTKFPLKNDIRHFKKKARLI